jgi:hypothetical protein
VISIKTIRLALSALAAFALLAAPFATVAQDKTPSSTAPAPAKALEVMGQHRGFTNDKLYLKLDNEKEMTFLVNIPGDKDWQWHKDFETLSRIAVTYHQGPGEALPVAIAIKKAGK